MRIQDDEGPADSPRVKSRWCEFCCWVHPLHECTAIVMTPQEEDEALLELNAVTVDRPAVSTYPDGPDAGVHAAWCGGHVEWRTPGGWIVRVFNDCGEWDYLAEIEAPDGRAWSYPCGDDGAPPWHAMTQRVADWTPIPPGRHGAEEVRARMTAWPGSEHLVTEPREIA